MAGRGVGEEFLALGGQLFPVLGFESGHPLEKFGGLLVAVGRKPRGELFVVVLGLLFDLNRNVQNILGVKT